jgi:hypothetical protein
VTFTGAGGEVMRSPANHQRWEKTVTWTLGWVIRPGGSTFSTREKIDGTSSYDGKNTDGSNVLGVCAGAVSWSGAHAVLGAFTVPAGGVPIPKGVKSLFVKGFPAIGAKERGKSDGEVQVPIFGPVAKACFGPATMAVAGGSYLQEDIGIIYALFPLNLQNPQPGRYVLPFHHWVYTQSNGATYNAHWSANVLVSVSH